METRQIEQRDLSQQLTVTAERLCVCMCVCVSWLCETRQTNMILAKKAHYTTTCPLVLVERIRLHLCKITPPPNSINGWYLSLWSKWILVFQLETVNKTPQLNGYVQISCLRRRLHSQTGDKWKEENVFLNKLPTRLWLWYGTSTKPGPLLKPNQPKWKVTKNKKE